jgi:bacteriocin-like protein
MTNFTELNTQEMNEVNGGSVISQAKNLVKDFAGNWVSGCKYLWNSTKEFVSGLFD